MIVLGIDPGGSGGIAALHFEDADTSGKVVDVAVHKMPETERDMLDLFGSFNGLDVRAYLEKVHASPGMGVVSAFSFGGNYKTIRTALIAKEIPFDEVTPQLWQKSIGGLVSKSVKVRKQEPSEQPAKAIKAFKKRDKNVSKRRAQELFPTVQKITHAYADALLIAEYGRRVERGMLARPPQEA